MRKYFLPLLVIIVALTYMSVFQVKEGDRGIVVRFGRLLKDADTNQVKVYQPGLHFKIPMFERVHILDARIQTMDDQADRFVTAEKKDVIIDSYVKWKIDNFGEYYLATGGGNRATAEALLKRKVVDSLRAQIGSKQIKQIVSGPDLRNVSVTDLDESNNIVAQVAPTARIDGQRDKIMDDVLTEIQDSAKSLGIDVVDFRMKKINLPDEISESIYRRMRAERESVARRHRSQGREKADVIRAQSELEVAKILANANRESLVIRGDADAKAAEIYAKSYAQNPEFYRFLRSLKAYENSFDSKNDVLVVDPNSDFFQYMKESVATQ